MSVSAMTVPTDAGAGRPWLRSRGWDLFFISLSVILVAAPYAIYPVAPAAGAVGEFALCQRLVEIAPAGVQAGILPAAPCH
ncbi:MAG: hypothetical protein PVG56_08705 [Anaerolineae bacterium]|jgi:hypothetical protein